MFAREHFEYYIYRRESVNVETDHQPLVSIVLKPLHKAPSQLQRMLLRLQKFNLRVGYKKGPNMFLADTLSRAHRSEVSACDFALSLTEVDHTLDLAIPGSQIQELKEASKSDPVIQALNTTIRGGCPVSKSAAPEIVHSYFNVRDKLTVQDDLVFKGNQLVIPYSLRRPMMEMVHDTHIGIDGCIRRARECMYWPRMSSELRGSSPSVMCVYLTNQSKPKNPWSSINLQLDLGARLELTCVSSMDEPCW